MNICKMCLNRFACNLPTENDVEMCNFYKVDKENLPKRIDWEQRRYELAKSAIIGILASPIVEGIDPNPSVPEIARHSVVIADAIIKELKGE